MHDFPVCRDSHPSTFVDPDIYVSLFLAAINCYFKGSKV